MPPRIYPTVAEAIETHRLLIDEFGGIHGLRDRALLEAAIFRPQSGYYGGLIDEAAALMESLATSHAFIDGNKRISFVMADAMLRANGYFIDVDAAAAHTFITKALENREFRFDAVRAWLRSNIKIIDHG
ncbi:MAG: type II toxin-antitoxin system death-on-curing family toxin [Candidatus Acidiferrales bacterium]